MSQNIAEQQDLQRDLERLLPRSCLLCEPAETAPFR
jgi:hypothetical protein